MFLSTAAPLTIVSLVSDKRADAMLRRQRGVSQDATGGFGDGLSLANKLSLGHNPLVFFCFFVFLFEEVISALLWPLSPRGAAIQGENHVSVLLESIRAHYLR